MKAELKKTGKWKGLFLFQDIFFLLQLDSKSSQVYKLVKSSLTHRSGRYGW